jgi:hypothetical protein
MNPSLSESKRRTVEQTREQSQRHRQSRPILHDRRPDGVGTLLHREAKEA